jgi:hypothetical protein
LASPRACAQPARLSSQVPERCPQGLKQPEPPCIQQDIKHCATTAFALPPSPRLAPQGVVTGDGRVAPWRLIAPHVARMGADRRPEVSGRGTALGKSSAGQLRLFRAPAGTSSCGTWVAHQFESGLFRGSTNDHPASCRSAA